MCMIEELVAFAFKDMFKKYFSSERLFSNPSIYNISETIAPQPLDAKGHNVPVSRQAR